MGTRGKLTLIPVIALFMGLLSLSAFSQNENDMLDFNASFSVYTNNYYSTNQEVSITLSAYSIPKRALFEFTIYKIKDVEAFFTRQTSTYTIDILSKDSTNLLYLCDEVDKFEKKLKTEGSSGYYYSYETITYKPKQKGAFLVKVSYKNKVAYAGFFVSDIGMITEASENAILAYTFDRKTGEPISDIDLSFYMGSRKMGIGKTAGGLFYKGVEESDREFAASNDISYPLVIGKMGEDIVVSDPYLYFGYGANRYSVYIYTNQPVYRPKAKVDFKGTIRKSSGGEFFNFPEKEITVTIKDSRGAEVNKQVLRTNSNGSFNGEYTIVDNAPLGDYYIYAMIDEGLSYTGSFTVEEYKKPEYKVGITLDKDQYTDGDNIIGVVQADYYFGSPVQDAEVEYNVYKKTFYKPWWYFSEYRWWYEEYYQNMDANYMYNNADFIYSGSGKLDKEGRFDFTYAVKEDFKAKNNYHNYWYWWDNEKSYESDFTYIIQAKVTDKSRREISSTKTVFVTRAQFYLNAKTDKYMYKPGEKVTVEVRSNDFGDKPVQTSFDGTVNRITWGKYPDYKQEKSFVTTISGSTREDGLGLASFDAKDEGYYEIEVKAYDSRGKKVTTSANCYVSTGDMWWWYNQSGTVQIIPDKDSYKPGEVCRALIVVPTQGAHVLITTQNDNILSYRVEKIDGTSKLIEIPIESNCSPNFFISAAYVTDGIFYNGSMSVMVIPETKFLTVTIGTDKTTYKPKEEGTMSIKVTDSYGNPVPNSEVSIGVVDESIYAIKQDNTKDIRKFFYSPKWNTVGVHYSGSYSYYGYSRLITIYERFNVKNLNESELGTIKGTIKDKKGNPIQYATIVIDGDFIATTTGSDGEFEFKLPEGSYTISVLQGKKTRESEQELDVEKGKTTKITLRSSQEGLIIGDEFGNIMQAPMTTESDISLDGVTTRSGRMLEDDKEETTGLKKEKSKNGKGDEDLRGGEFIEAELRSDFKDAIYWSPSVMTDANGYATVNVKFPDNLTTWRITSRVITEDTKVGQMTNTVITRKDLLVRMETPRFLQQNDEVTIATIVHNYLESDKNTKLSFKVENLEMIGDSQEKTFVMDKNSEKRIDWKIKVTEPNGFAKLTVTALTDEESDAVELKVPLQPHGLKLDKYLATDISDISRTEFKEIKIPEFTDLRSTKLTLNVEPSLASTMLTALDELVGYPYGCVEQTMSRFLPTVIVADAFHELNAPLSDATKKDLPKMVEAGFNRLYSMQHYDGGWGWWTNDQSQPFMTSYVIYGLTLAKTAGYEVRKDVLTKGITSLKSQMNNKDVDMTTRAYMLYTYSFTDSKDSKIYTEQLKKLETEKLNDYAIGLISMSATNFGDDETARKYNDMLMKTVQNAGETGAYWGGEAWHYSWQDDKVQTTAMVVKALVNSQSYVSQNPEILNKAIRWLMMQRHGGGWNSTQQTAFIVYAMVDYLKKSNELQPDYSVKVYVNNEVVLDKKMTREDVFAKSVPIEIEGIKLRTGVNDIKIEKEGAGKVYVSSQLSYYTNEERIQPREEGFRVEKEYFKLEKYTRYSDSKIVYKKRYFDGTLKSGDEILVKVRVSSKDNNMQYFMLEDPIPAGCEVIKDDWAYTIDEEKDYSGWDYYWWRWWYADKDIRDNRVSFFATYMWGDTQEFSYILRAQIPGTYNVIPATGMLMYYPEIRGSSEELRIVIEE